MRVKKRPTFRYKTHMYVYMVEEEYDVNNGYRTKWASKGVEDLGMVS